MSMQQLSPNEQWPELPAHGAMPKLNGHSREWCNAVSKGLRHPLIVLTIRDDRSTPVAILPLMHVKSFLFGSFLVSLPYLNSGGVWAIDADAARQIVTHACDLADQLQVRHLELRHEVRVEHPKLTLERSDKVHLRLPLPRTNEELDKSFKSKLRSQIKKSNEYGLDARWGGEELLPHFYDVFSRNMRDLGTPVFSKELFRQILIAFGESHSDLCVVYRNQLPIASALLVHANGCTEVPSASSLREHNSTNANMWMYRHLLSRAIEHGSHTFDFGRSTQGSGTYQFKTQWGAKPCPATWQFYVRNGNVENLRPDSNRNQRLIKLWKRLPLWLTRLAGPSIVRGIP